MSKVLFLYEQNFNNSNELRHQKVVDSFDCEFSNYNAEEIQNKIQNEGFVLIVAYLHGMTSESKRQFSILLTNEANAFFVLFGTHEELHKYYARTPAKVIRYQATPITVNDFIDVVNGAFNFIEKGQVPANVKIEPPTQAAAEAPAPLKVRKNILVVDDDPVSLRTYANWLKEDFDVAVAKSGTNALAFLGKKIPDLILLDYEMPVLNGLKTLELIRSEENFKDIPVIFLTGVSDPNMVKEAIMLKPAGYILKGENMESFLKKLDDIIYRIAHP